MAMTCRVCGQPIDDHAGPGDMCRARVGRDECICLRFIPNHKPTNS